MTLGSKVKSKCDRMVQEVRTRDSVCAAGKLTHNKVRAGSSRKARSRWMPPPAVIHCTFPGSRAWACRRLSPCSRGPSRTHRHGLDPMVRMPLEAGTGSVLHHDRKRVGPLDVIGGDYQGVIAHLIVRSQRLLVGTRFTVRRMGFIWSGILRVLQGLGGPISLHKPAAPAGEAESPPRQRDSGGTAGAFAVGRREDVSGASDTSLLCQAKFLGFIWLAGMMPRRPFWKSSIAWRISSRLFITKGP